MDTTWNEMVLAKLYGMIPSTSFYDCCRDRCTPLIDVRGDIFADYVLFLIIAFWRQPGRTYR
jgi:hypothetical protein